jgi:hypothetical protein
VRETQDWHEQLWELLREDPRVDANLFVHRTSLDAPNDHDSDSDGDPPEPLTAIDAGLLAIQENLAFLADDRVLQNMVIQTRNGRGSAVFGTDTILMGLLATGLIDRASAARAFIQLMKWRYRFLVFPPEILRIIATEFPPIDRRCVACYVHDCMRDVGLFGGLEQTDPPIPIAFRFFQDWLQSIAAFIADVWLDKSITDIRAQELTAWATTELLPTIPSVLGVHVGRLAEFTAFTVLGMALGRLCATADHDRANRALRQIGKGLGLDDALFSRYLADLVDHHGSE